MLDASCQLAADEALIGRVTEGRALARPAVVLWGYVEDKLYILSDLDYMFQVLLSFVCV